MEWNIDLFNRIFLPQIYLSGYWIFLIYEYFLLLFQLDISYAVHI